MNPAALPKPQSMTAAQKTIEIERAKQKQSEQNDTIKKIAVVGSFFTFSALASQLINSYSIKKAYEYGMNNVMALTGIKRLVFDDSPAPPVQLAIAARPTQVSDKKEIFDDSPAPPIQPAIAAHPMPVSDKKEITEPSNKATQPWAGLYAKVSSVLSSIFPNPSASPDTTTKDLPSVKTQSAEKPQPKDSSPSKPLAEIVSREETVSVSSSSASFATVHPTKEVAHSEEMELVGVCPEDSSLGIYQKKPPQPRSFKSWISEWLFGTAKKAQEPAEEESYCIFNSNKAFKGYGSEEQPHEAEELIRLPDLSFKILNLAVKTSKNGPAEFFQVSPDEDSLVSVKQGGIDVVMEAAFAEGKKSVQFAEPMRTITPSLEDPIPTTLHEDLASEKVISEHTDPTLEGNLTYNDGIPINIPTSVVKEAINEELLDKIGENIQSLYTGFSETSNVSYSEEEMDIEILNQQEMSPNRLTFQEATKAFLKTNGKSVAKAASVLAVASTVGYIAINYLIPSFNSWYKNRNEPQKNSPPPEKTV